MKNTIIYNHSGRIVMTTSETDLGTVAAVEAEIPEGFYAESVDTDTNEPVLAAIPKTAEQKRMDDLEAAIAALKKSSEAKDDALSEQQDFQEDCIAEMASVVYADDGETA